MAAIQEILKWRFDYKPGLHFLDASLSALIGYGAAIIYLITTWKQGVVEIFSLFIAAAAIFRLWCFIHEIVHVPQRGMGHFNFFGISWLAFPFPFLPFFT